MKRKHRKQLNDLKYFAIGGIIGLVIALWLCGYMPHNYPF